MASVVVANAQEGADPSVPRRADGGLYRYEMIFGGFAARVYADSVTELCEHLIPGYAELDEDVAQAAARIECAVRAQVHVQADIVAQHGMEGCTPAERELLMGSRHEPPMVGEWQPDVPLVLVDVYYEPLGPLPQPTGRPRGGGAEGSNSPTTWRPWTSLPRVDEQVGLAPAAVAPPTIAVSETATAPTTTPRTDSGRFTPAPPPSRGR